MNLWQKASELFSISSHHTKNSDQFRILGHDSTARDIYCKSNEKIERMSGLMGKYFAKLQIIPQSIIFFLRANLNYYIFNLGEDSFELPVQAVYVVILNSSNALEKNLKLLRLQVAIQLEDTVGLLDCFHN